MIARTENKNLIHLKANGTSNAASATFESSGQESSAGFRDLGSDSSGLWSGRDGFTIMTLGVLLPAVVVIMCGIANLEPLFRLVLKQPIETLVEIAAALALPLANYITWAALRRDNRWHHKRVSLMNGMAIGIATFAGLVSTSAFIHGCSPGSHCASLLGAISWISVISWLSVAPAIYMTNRIRREWGTESARLRSATLTLCGAVMAVGTLVATEARATCTQVAAHMAISESPKRREAGLQFLRRLNPERELRLACADPRTAGLPGLLWGIDPVTSRRLYFAVIGKPYRDGQSAKVASMPDDYLATHVVGAPIPGLSLIRSAITGGVHPDTLSSTLNWTFVFKNRTGQEQEARAEIALPDDSVVSGLTVWINGQPRNAEIHTADQRLQDWSVRNWSYPAKVTDLGRGRVLLQCSPVPAFGELKANVTVAASLKLDNVKEASFSLPSFIDTNFNLEAKTHTLRLRSPEELSVSLEGATKSKLSNGERLLQASFKDPDHLRSKLSVFASRQAAATVFAAADQHSDKFTYVVQTVKEVTPTIPSHLVVVVDGSNTMQDQVKDVSAALAELPGNVKASLLIASDTGNQELLPLPEGLKVLEKSRLEGGQDNLEFIIKAAETAGQDKDGAVLWIHGPQPAFNDEIYIMAPFTASPRFYECAVNNGWADDEEFFKNHREIGPLVGLPRNGKLRDDLRRFISQWQPGRKQYVVEYHHTNEKPKARFVSNKQAEEIAMLSARGECASLIARGDKSQAIEIAQNYGLVTQGTFAAAPFLQGATNGTIGPQQGDAAVVAGVNTAGTVRVNNIASLEACLSILANACQMLGIVFGAIQLLRGMSRWHSKSTVAGGMIAVGLSIMLIGMAVPGCVNWMVSSARDANLFS